MELRNISLFIILSILILSCKKEEQSQISSEKEVRYYPNGQVQFICNLKDSLRNGEGKGWYENGDIKYQGWFNNGLMYGSHKEFYRGDSAKIHYEQIYEIENNRSKLIRSKSYDRNGALTYEMEYVNKTVEVLGADSVMLNDSLIVKLLLVEPKHEFIRAYTGNIDKVTGQIDKGTIIHHNGENRSVTLRSKATNPGWNTIEGYLINFTIQPAGDSVYVGVKGYEKGEATYFSHKYYVIPRNDLEI